MIDALKAYGNFSKAKINEIAPQKEFSSKDENCMFIQTNSKANTVGSVSAPTVPAIAVVQVSDADQEALRNKSIVPPISEHFQESGMYGNIKYIVIDGIRYETKVQAKKEDSKTLIDVLNDADIKRKEESSNSDYIPDRLKYLKTSNINTSKGTNIVYGNVSASTLNKITNLLEEL